MYSVEDAKPDEPLKYGTRCNYQTKALRQAQLHCGPTLGTAGHPTGRGSPFFWFAVEAVTGITTSVSCVCAVYYMRCESPQPRYPAFSLGSFTASFLLLSNSALSGLFSTRFQLLKNSTTTPSTPAVASWIWCQDSPSGSDLRSPS